MATFDHDRCKHTDPDTGQCPALGTRLHMYYASRFVVRKARYCREHSAEHLEGDVDVTDVPYGY